MNQADLIERRAPPGFKLWIGVMAKLAPKTMQLLAGKLTGNHCPLSLLTGTALGDLSDALWSHWHPWTKTN